MASRSLGTLTVDLIAKIGGFAKGMTEAERAADKSGREMQKKMEARAKEVEAAWTKINVALAVGVSGLGVMVGKVVNQAGEIANLANVASSTTGEFQRMAAAAGSVGIQQDKLSDQLKDFTEKVGEFQATGGGGMKDFFENIAPKIGITADAFRGLSGPQALQLYYDSLEKAGVNQQQMSFYLESMASDTTALIPILADGGKMLQSLGDAAEAAGTVMDEKTIAAAQVMQVQMGLLKQQGEGLVTQMVAAMIPTLADVAGEFSKVGIEGSLAGQAGDVFATAFKTVAAVAVGAYGAVSLLGKALGGMAAIADVSWLEDMSLMDRLTPMGAIKQLQNLGELGSKLGAAGRAGKEMLADLDVEAQRLGGTIANIMGAGSGNTDSSASARAIVEQRKALQDAMRNSQGMPVNADAGSKKSGKSQAEKDGDAAIRYLETLKQQAAQVKEMGAYEKLLYDLKQGTLKFSTAAQAKEAEALAIQADFAKDGAKILEEQNRLKEEGKRLTEQTLTPLEQLRAEQEKINSLLAGGHVSPEVAQRALTQAQASTYGAGNDVGKWVKGDVSPLSGGMFDNQTQRYEAEATAEQERYAEQLTRLQEAMATQQMQREQGYALEEQLAQVHADRMEQIEKAKSDLMINNMAAGFGQMATDLSAFSQQFGIENKAMLGVMKTASIAQTVISTYAAAQKAYESMIGIPYVGPALGMAAAAAAVAGGMARVAAIRSQGFADGGYTGPGSKYTPAGIVHAGEGVLSQEDMAALGGPSAFEAFRRSLHSGYADGGYVGTVPAAQPGYAASRYQQAGNVPVVNVIEDSSKAGQIEQGTDAQGQNYTNVFVRNIRNGGEEAAALEATYGLTRRGR